METNTSLSPNMLAFIALSNEYCVAVEQAAATDRSDFIDSMLRLLPRIYISASDIQSIEEQQMTQEDVYFTDVLDEDTYEAIRGTLSALFGEDDIYLEVFAEDMKYSDTPVSASISENLADIYQVLYNMIHFVRDAFESQIEACVVNCYSDFKEYWSATLCNVLRQLNALKFNPM